MEFSASAIILYHVYKEPDIVRIIKIYRLRWVRHIERMEEGQPTKHISNRNQLVVEKGEDSEDVYKRQV